MPVMAQHAQLLHDQMGKAIMVPNSPHSQSGWEKDNQAGSKRSHCAADISRLALSTVFCSSMVMVIGPTPPGTGVMNPARSLASWKATSPTSL